MKGFVCPLVAFELDNIYDYNALRATHSSVKNAIDNAPETLKRTMFFDVTKRTWVGQYSQRVRRRNDDACCVSVWIRHPLLDALYPPHEFNIILGICFVEVMSFPQFLEWVEKHMIIRYLCAYPKRSAPKRCIQSVVLDERTWRTVVFADIIQELDAIINASKGL